MAYGFQILNANNEYLLTDEYVKPWFLGKGTGTSIQGPVPIQFQEYNGSTYIQRNFNKYIINYNIPTLNGVQKQGFAAITLPNTSIFYAPQTYWISGSNYTVTVLVPTSISAAPSDAPEIYLFCFESINSPTTSGYGLQIFNQYQQCMFDSNFQPFRPIEAQTTILPNIGLELVGDNPKIYQSSTPVNYSGSTINFNYAFSKPIFVLPERTITLRVVSPFAGSLTYYTNYGDWYWEYVTKNFYNRTSSLQINSKSYPYEISYQQETDPAGKSWVFSNNSEPFLVLSDGARYASTSGGTFPNATYSLSVSPANPVEGTPFTITITTTGVPNNTSFTWTLQGPGLDTTDFSGTYSSGTIVIVNNTAQITFTPLIDSVVDTENYVFELIDSNLVVVKSLGFTLTNTTYTPTYILSKTPATGSINEGSSFTISVATNYVAVGTVLNYTVSGGLDNLDISNNGHLNGSFPALTGTFQNGTTSKTFTTLPDLRTDGQKTFTLTLSHGGNPSIQVVINDTSQGLANGELVNLTGPTTSNEGVSISIVANWDLSYDYDGRLFALQGHTGNTTDGNDGTVSPNTWVALQSIFSGGELIALRRTWTIAIAADVTTEGPETLSLKLVDQSGFIYDIHTVTISDTSQGARPTVELYTTSPAVDVNSGLIYLNETTTKTLSLVVLLTHTAANIPVYWKTVGSAGLTLDDFDTSLNGTIYTVAGSEPVSLPDITVKTDYTTEITAESFYIDFYSDSNYTDLLYQAPTVSVNDTSQTPNLSISNVTITPNPVNEGNGVSCVFTIQDSTVRNVYFKIVGGAGFTSADVASYTPANNTIATATGAGAQRTITVNLSADSTTEGTEQFSIYFFTEATWNSGSPVDSNRWHVIGPISVNDTSQAAAVRTLSRSVASVNEGQSFSITFATNQPGSFAYTITGVTSADIGGASLTGSVTNLSGLNYTASADSTTEGNETFTITLNDYPTVTTSVTIVDTSLTAPPLAETLSLNTLGQSLNGSSSYITNNVYWVTWTLSSSTAIVFSTEHELPISTNGTDTTIAIYNSNGELQHISGAGDDAGVNGRGVDYSSRLELTLAAGTYYGAIGVYAAGYSFSNYFATSNFNLTTLQNSLSNIRISLWTGTPFPRIITNSINTSINEGDTATFSATILDTVDRTLYYRVVPVGATSADITGSTSGSTLNLWPRSTYNFQIQAVADLITETGTEGFRWDISTTSDFSGFFSSSNIVQINDTSQTAVPTYSFGSPPGDLSEGVQYSIQFNATNANGVTPSFYAQAPNNGGANGMGDVTLQTSSVAINSNSFTAQIYFTPVQDYSAESDEWFRIEAYIPGTGTVIATSANIKIVAKGAPSYSLSIPYSSMNEGTSYQGTLTVSNIRNTTFTLRADPPSSGTSASSEVTVSPSSWTSSSTNDNDSVTVTVTPSADGVVETDEYFRVGAYIGTSLATQTGNILIPGTGSAPTGTFSVSPAFFTSPATVTATWNITSNPTSTVSITGNGGSWTGLGMTGSSYQLETGVTNEATYTLTATNSIGTLTLNSSTTVSTPTATLTASTTTGTVGDTITLYYTTANATSAAIINGGGAVSPGISSSVNVVLPNTSTITYQLIASNVQKSASSSVTITIQAAPPDISSVVISPNPIQAISGGLVPYSVTVNLTSAVSVARTVDLVISGSLDFDGTYADFISIAAGASSGTWSNTSGLGSEQGTRNVLVLAKKTGVFASEKSVIWQMLAPSGSGTWSATGSNLWNYSGAGTSASPFTGTSSNSSQANTTAYINFIVQNGGGTVYYNISSNSEANWDYVRIQKNGVNQAEKSGIGQNMTGSFTVAATNTVRVEYSKDGSVDSGSDSATINSLYFVPS